MTDLEDYSLYEPAAGLDARHRYVGKEASRVPVKHKPEHPMGSHTTMAVTVDPTTEQVYATITRGVFPEPEALESEPEPTESVPPGALEWLRNDVEELDE